MGDLFECRCESSYLTNIDSIRQVCLDLVRESRLTVVEDKFHQFPDWNGHPGGVTGCVLLAESHLAIHTWPEIQGITLDIYVCNFTVDNSSKAEILFDGLIKELHPDVVRIKRVLRADVDRHKHLT